MKTDFTTDYTQILAKLNSFTTKNYKFTRNYLNGEVSQLSPYITHGVISMPQVAKQVIAHNGLKQAEHFLFQLGWREYFLKIWWNLGDSVFEPVRSEQSFVYYDQLPESVLNASTGVVVLDEAVKSLYGLGYLHNHERMWLASVVCNTAKTQFSPGMSWMYYYLLDGDLASNTLSWQWVAGSFSSKKYLANQDNLNKYSKLVQKGTFLDFEYPELARRAESDYCPTELLKRSDLEFPVNLPDVDGEFVFDKIQAEWFAHAGGENEVLLYHPWALSPEWFAENGGDKVRVLVFEPSHFSKFRISPMRVEFILGLARNIPNLKVVVADFERVVEQLVDLKVRGGVVRDYPAVFGWKQVASEAGFGLVVEDYEFLYPGVVPPFRSYFDFWNKASKLISRI